MILLEASHACSRPIGDDDRSLIEFTGESLDRRSDAEGVRAGQQQLAVGSQDTPCLGQVKGGGRAALLKMDQDLAEALVCKTQGRIDRVEIGRSSGEKTIAPGLHDAAAMRDHSQVGLEFADGPLTQHARIKRQGLGSSIASVRHSGNNIVEWCKRANLRSIATAKLDRRL